MRYLVRGKSFIVVFCIVVATLVLTSSVAMGQIPASIGDFVWHDLNANGIQDPGEPGIGNVTVRLQECAGPEIDTTTTSGNGFYRFTNLGPGAYRIQFDLLGGYRFSPQDQGGDDTKDSDPDPSTGITACTTLEIGEDDDTWDAGMYQYGTVIIGKQTIPAGSLQDFDFTGTFGPFILRDGITNGFGNVVPGISPSVYETVPTGWTLTSASCDDGSDPSAIDLQSGETVTCTFINTENPKAVPTVTEWGLIVMSLLLIGSAAWFISRRKHNV